MGFFDELTKRMDPRRGALGRIDLLDPAVAGTIGLIVGGPAGAAIGAGTGATVKSMEAAQAAAGYQRQAMQAQATMQQQQALRQRRSAIRSSILARSQMRAQAQALGTFDTSGFAGGLGSISSQLGANLGFGSMMSGLGEQYSQLSMAAVQQQGQAALYGSIADIGFGFGQRLTPAQKPTQ